MGKTERRELPALLSLCLFSEKCSPSCTSTMPAQNDRGYCTPNHCVVGRERERNRGRERIDVECDSSETEREKYSQEKRYKDPKDRSKKAERANTNRVIAA